MTTPVRNESRLDSFYLGRRYDLNSKTVLKDESEIIDYQSKDLCTHGVIVGMTGSGKTGLAIALMEEAACDGIPCIIIDPKGDLSNMLLQFDDYEPHHFEEWLDPTELAQKKVSKTDYAKQLAERRKKGFEEAGHDVARVKEIAERSEYRIYTPGSEAGLALSILQSFTAPKEPKDKILLEDLNQKIDATASAVLGLTGISADPVQSKEHILIANLLKHAWTQNPPRDLTLENLIEWIQTPPITKVGALELDKFYKEKDRMKLAVALNNILAAPSFETWLKGDPLDLTSLLAGPKAKQLIFSVAHLDDSQRMFFITLLLSEVLSWTRKQSGSSSLRAIVYFDEVFGYLPPHPGNPPTKQPLMTLLKQARAFGVGILLATQNPVDIDYKALSNAGTWFVGKLQTERDKARLLDGLDSAAAERGSRNNRAEIEKTIASLGNRVFLLHNIHRGAEPTVFQTRWALSYLRGPMTREEIARLMEPFKSGHATPAVVPAPAPVVPPPPSVPAPTPVAAEPVTSTVTAAPPPPAPIVAAPPVAVAAPPPVAVVVQDPEPTGTTAIVPETPAIARHFLPIRAAGPGDAGLVYQPFLLGCAEVVGVDKKMGRKYPQTLRLVVAVPPEGQSADWSKAETIPEGIDNQPQPAKRFSDVPLSISTPAKVTDLKKQFETYLAGMKVKVARCDKLNMTIGSGEDPTAFAARCQKEAWKEFEKKLAEEKATYGGEFARYKVEPPLPPVATEGTSWEELWKPYLPGGPVLRASSASLTPKEKGELENLENDWHNEIGRQAETWKRVVDQLGKLELPVEKKEIKVTVFALAWVPFWEGAGGGTLLPAYR